MPSLPVYAPIESRDGSLAKGAFTKNAVVEKVGEAFYTFKRPGLALYSTSTAGTGQGITNFFSPNGDEYLLSVLGGSIYNSGGRLPSLTWNPGATGITAGAGTGNQWSLVSWRGYLWAIGGVVDGAASRFTVAYSTDHGETWNKVVDVADGTAGYPASKYWVPVVHNGELYLVYGSLGTPSRDTWKTSNGVAWTEVNNGTTGPASAVCNGAVSFGGNLYAFFDATTSNGIWKSTDNGVNWALETANPSYNTSGTARAYFRVTNTGPKVYVLGGDCGASADAKVYYSTNMTTWTEAGTNALSGVVGGTGVPNSVHVVAHLGLLLLIGWVNTGTGTGTGTVYYSTDGATWTSVGTLNDAATTGYPDFTGGSSDELWAWLSNVNGAGFCVHKGRFCVNSKANGGTYKRAFFSLPLDAEAPAVSIGSVGSGMADFTQNFARSLLAIKSQDKLYSLTIPAMTLTQVTDADYPPVTVRGIVYLNGVFYVMDADGTIYGSDDEDLTAWDPLNFINAEFEPDGGVALVKYQFYVVAFGEYTTEYFYDAGNASGSPLSPVQNGVLNIGCADADTMVSVDDTVLFVGRAKGPSQSTTGSRFVAQLEGTNAKRISTPDIDRILLADDFADVEAVAFSVAGHSYYCLNLGTSALSLVFDLSQQVWTVWDRRRTSFTHTPSGIVTSAGTATYTGTTSFADGDVGVVTAFSGTHTALNGTYNMIVPASGTLCWYLGGTSYSGTSTGTGTATGWSANDFGIVSACGYQGSQLAQDATNGKIYTIDPDTYQDDSVYMDWQLRAGKMDLGSNKQKFAAYADFISDRASGNVLMRVSDDDSQSWSKYRPKSLSLNRTRFNRGGAFTRRVYDFRITDNIPVRAQRVEYQVDEGAE